MAKVLVLRTSDKDRKAYGGFQWPAEGPVEAPDWNPRAECGNGLHGLLWGQGNANHMSSEPDATWQVVEVESEAIVKIDDEKVKFPRGTVIYSGARVGALKMVMAGKERIAALLEMSSTTTTGDSAHSTTTGHSAHSTTTGDSAHSTTTGYSAHSTTTGYSAHSVVKGQRAVAMAAGLDSFVQAAEGGAFAASYWDEKKERMRILVGHVGEDDIKADTLYRVKAYKNGKAKWVEVK